MSFKSDVIEIVEMVYILKQHISVLTIRFALPCSVQFIPYLEEGYPLLITQSFIIEGDISAFKK